jgi:hypothetical protein
VATVRPRAVLTQRASAEACRRVGKDAMRWPRWRVTSGLARKVMRAVAEHGTPLVEDPARLEGSDLFLSWR